MYVAVEEAYIDAVQECWIYGLVHDMRDSDGLGNFARHGELDKKRLRHAF